MDSQSEITEPWLMRCRPLLFECALWSLTSSFLKLFSMTLLRFHFSGVDDTHTNQTAQCTSIQKYRRSNNDRLSFMPGYTKIHNDTPWKHPQWPFSLLTITCCLQTEVLRSFSGKIIRSKPTMKRSHDA